MSEVRIKLWLVISKNYSGKFGKWSWKNDGNIKSRAEWAESRRVWRVHAINVRGRSYWRWLGEFLISTVAPLIFIRNTCSQVHQACKVRNIYVLLIYTVFKTKYKTTIFKLYLQSLLSAELKVAKESADNRGAKTKVVSYHLYTFTCGHFEVMNILEHCCCIWALNELVRTYHANLVASHRRSTLQYPAVLCHHGIESLRNQPVGKVSR